MLKEFVVLLAMFGILFQEGDAQGRYRSVLCRPGVKGCECWPAWVAPTPLSVDECYEKCKEWQNFNWLPNPANPERGGRCLCVATVAKCRPKEGMTLYQVLHNYN